MNFNTQYYNNIPLRLIDRKYKNYNAKRYVINNTNQNIWIPNCYLLEDGTIKKNVKLDWLFNKFHTKNKMKIAGVKDE